MPKQTANPGFTLIEILVVSLILSLSAIFGLSLSISYKQKHEIEVTAINIASFIDVARQQSIINFEKQQHGIKISPSQNTFSQVSRTSPTDTPITNSQISIPDSFTISDPNSEKILWFDKKTGFIEPTSMINQITISASGFTTNLLISNTGNISTTPAFQP